jgi:Superfamily II DNA and RNA helicases
MTQFSSFGLPDFLLTALDAMGIHTPSPIQAAAVPPAMTGKDILASAQTGSGKTIAYLLPLIIHTMQAKKHALILLPTRELALQVKLAILKLIGRQSPLRVSLLIGGEPIFKQKMDLKKDPQIVVGTPGRVCDHLNRGSLSLHATQFLVLDETDRMLDMGFSDDLDMIMGQLPEERQTLMFSATIPPGCAKMTQKYLKTPERIAIGSVEKPAASIKQEVIRTSHREKFTLLLQQLKEREGSIIVFVKTRRSADEIARELQEQDHNADALHGDLHQRQRERVVQSFRTQRSRIMVATDIAARGLDIPHIQHVINYDLPSCPEDYIHRIGRTGRQEATGCAVSLVSPDNEKEWKRIHRFMNPDGRGEPEKGGFGERRKPSGFSKPYGNSGPKRGAPPRRSGGGSFRPARTEKRYED